MDNILKLTLVDSLSLLKFKREHTEWSGVDDPRLIAVELTEQSITNLLNVLTEETNAII